MPQPDTTTRSIFSSLYVCEGATLGIIATESKHAWVTRNFLRRVLMLPTFLITFVSRRELNPRGKARLTPFKGNNKSSNLEFKCWLNIDLPSTNTIHFLLLYSDVLVPLFLQKLEAAMWTRTNSVPGLSRFITISVLYLQSPYLRYSWFLLHLAGSATVFLLREYVLTLRPIFKN